MERKSINLICGGSQWKWDINVHAWVHPKFDIEVLNRNDRPDAHGNPLGHICDDTAGFSSFDVIVICDSTFTYPSTLQEVKGRNSPDDTNIYRQMFPGVVLLHELMHASTYELGDDKSKKFFLPPFYTRISLI